MTHKSITSLLLQPSGGIPNNPTLPVLYYPQVIANGSNLVEQFKKKFAENNWKGTWVNGIFDYHHYHSTSHEALGVAAGSAEVILGGPGGETVNLEVGDMVVLPAGTGHCLKSSSSNFKVVGAYPSGQENYDICTEKDNMTDKLKNIKQVALPTADPVAGEDGPIMKIWKDKV